MDERNIIVNSIQETLTSISSEEEIIQFSDTPVQFDDNKYVKLENNELADILNVSLSKIPAIAVVTSNIANVEQVNRIVSDGVFKVVFKNGVTDQSISNLCKNSEGLLTTVYRDSNGFNQAGLASVGQEITDKMNAITTEKVINGIMAVASKVVGCYYMHNIDNKLNNINQKLDKLIEISDDEKVAKIQSVYELLIEITSKFHSNYLNEMQLSSYHNEIVRSCRDIKGIVNYYQVHLEKIVNDIVHLNKNFSEKIFKQLFSDFKKYLFYYKYAFDIYVMAITVETIISRNISEKYIYDQINAVIEYSNVCEKRIYEWLTVIKTILCYDIHDSDKITKLLKDKVIFIKEDYNGANNRQLVAELDSFARELEIKNPIGVFCSNNILSRKSKGIFLSKGIEQLQERKKQRQEHQKQNVEKNNSNIFNNSFMMLENYFNRIKLIQNNEMRLCYYKGDVYIDKEYLQEITDDNIDET